MMKLLRAIGVLVGLALLAVAITGVISGIWTGVLLANLKFSPTIPWSTPVMLAVLALLWWMMGGWGRRSPVRTIALRAAPLPVSVTLWALAAGLLSLAALVGFWIVEHRLVATPPALRPDYSKLGAVTVLVMLATASISGGISEEAGFRGYFQGAMERRGFGPAAILVTALVMAPEHALTQGFVWPTMVFYLLVDIMLGALAYITKSIGPGIVVHAIGLFVFFAYVWPHDHERALISQGGPDQMFWLSLGGMVVFSLAGIAAFFGLARAVRKT
jgi:membrane protease YdiL (CAAX protease family)